MHLVDLERDRIDLAWRMKATAGSRYNAERLRTRDKRINILNALASALVIFLSVVPLAVKADGMIGIAVTLITIFASIMILVTALLQFASEDALKAERLHKSGLEITALRRILVYQELHEREHLLQLAKDYDAILARYPNHNAPDYERYRREHPEEFKKGLERGSGPGGSGLELVKAQIPFVAGFILTFLTISVIAIAFFGSDQGLTINW